MNGDGETFGRRRPAPPADKTPSRPPWPLWPLFLAAMAPAYLLQQVPLLNLLLLFALSPFWIGILLHAALLAMVVDVRRRAAPRWLLAVPILVYGGNLAWSVYSDLNARALDARLRRENAAQHLPFDAARSGVVAPEALAQDLVQHYALPVAFTGDGEPGGLKEPVSLRVLPAAVCKTIDPSPDRRMRIEYGGFAKDRLENACVLRLPGAPDRPVTRILRDPPEAGLESRARLVLIAPGGRTATLAFGRVAIAWPVPFPIVGCVDWNRRECVAQLATYSRSVGGHEADAPAMVAAVLGLAPRKASVTPARRGRAVVRLDEAQTLALAAGSEAAVAQAQAFGRKSLDATLARFSRLMAGEDLARGETLDRWTVITHADEVDAETLLAAIAQAHGAARRSDSQAAFGDVAAALPPKAFERIGARLAPLVATDEALAGSDTLAIRLGDVGAAAVPPLTALLDTPAITTRTSALLGLCRAGPSASGAADRVAAIARDDKRADVIEAAVLALLRMDRRDLAEAVASTPASNGFNGPARRGYRRDIDQALSEVHAGSPRSSCRLEDASPLPRLPWLD